MRIGEVGQGQHLTAPLSNLRPGQRLLVQVERRDASGLGVIRLDGQVTKAFLDISVEAGDQFWATVKENGANGLLLVRESPSPTDGVVSATLKPGGAAPGFPALQVEVQAALEAFTQQRSLPEMGPEKGMDPAGLVVLLRDIPEWGQFSDQGLEMILNQFRQLGLNYEERLRQALRLTGEARKKEIIDLKNTWKGRILRALTGEEKEGRSGARSHSRVRLASLLQELTGQQLWLLGGAEENAYALGKLLFQFDSGVYQARVAFEGSRQGEKVDPNHCHFGVITETPALGELGIEAWIHEDSLTLKFFSAEPEFIRPVLDGALPGARTQFARWGWLLQSLDLQDWDEAGAFREFLEGRRRSGVDLQG